MTGGTLLERIAAELQRRVPRRAQSGTYEHEAAVAIMLRPARSELEFLAIKRAEHETDPWSGHMALPGGRREPVDQDIWLTAVRETREEVGIDLSRTGQRLGRLDDVRPLSRRLPQVAITPFVVAVDPVPDVVEGPEVDRAVWLPLEIVVSERHQGVMRHEAAGDQEFPTIEYGGEVIWGLTFTILGQFAEVLRRVGYPGDEW